MYEEYDTCTVICLDITNTYGDTHAIEKLKLRENANKHSKRITNTNIQMY